MVITCKKPCKKMKSTMLTVEQMVDIALGTPEIGAVNFNVLHALIHVMVQQLNIQKCLVEFKGYDSDRMEGIILSAKPGPILKLSEYMIDVSDGKPCPGKDKTPKREDEDQERKETTSKKPPCECAGKKKKPADDEKEKADKSKDESDTEEKKILEKKIKQEPVDECQEVDEPEPKKVKIPDKPKPCPCKGVKDPELAADETLKAVPSSYYGSDSEGACQTIVRVEPVGEKCDNWRSRPALAHESMVKLEEKVAMLQDAFEALEQLPTNEELKKRTQGTGCPSTPVKDLWQLYNLNKRVESCEGAIEKLASMIEDLVKETCNFREAMLVIADAVDEMECADETARTCCAAVQGHISGGGVGGGGGGGGARLGSGTGGGAPVGTSALSKGARGTSASKVSEGQTVTFSNCNGQPCKEEKESELQPPPPQKPPEPTPAPAKPPETTDPSPEQPPPIKTEEDNKEQEESVPEAALESATIHEGPLPPQQGGIGPEFFKMSAGEKFCVLKQNIDCLLCQMKNLTENNVNQQMASKLCALVSMQRQLDALEKEWKAFLDTFGEDGVGGLSNLIKNMRKDIDNLNSLTAKLMAAVQELSAAAQDQKRDTEHLNLIKADLEMVEDLLAEKADAALVKRKVSHDQFDAACDDLTRGLDEALRRLMNQEALWNEALDEIHANMDNKLDKNEIMPLKEFINKKLKCLQEKLKQLAQLRKDAEAAGAKSRILRNLNCIACDGDVVMKMDNKTSYQCPSMSPSKGIKPLLTYELDQVRKAMKKGPPCRGMTSVEEAVTDVPRKAAGIPLKTRDAVDSKISKLAHFCNRYCGGSHTVTTPQQRVTRIGHFLTEFGPQALALFTQDALDSKCPQGMITPDDDYRKSY